MSQRVFNNCILEIRTGDILSFTDEGAGVVGVVVEWHAFEDGDLMTITNTVGYNGVYAVTVIDAETLNITATWSITETGTWSQELTISVGDFITGSGQLNSIGYDDAYTTLNHCIRNMRLDLLEKTQVSLNGDWSHLETDGRETDDANFGGTHTFYYDDTLIESFDGVITTVYHPDNRVTDVSIQGEGHGQ